MKRILILAVVLAALLGLGQASLADCGDCCQDCVGTGTPGYWMNHPEAWPTCGVQIGGVWYPKDVAIEAMKNPVKGDKSYTMFPALVAAIQNVKIGNRSCCIMETIYEADWWMSQFPLGSGVKGSSEAWQASHGEQLYMKLDAYNNGRLCAPSRDSLE